MDTNLPEVVAGIFMHHGAIVESAGDENIEFLAPPLLAQRLAIHEHGTLTFVRNEARDDAIYASYDSELFRSLEGLLTEKGRCAAATYIVETPFVREEKLVKALNEKELFTNAVFRHEKAEEKIIPYVLVHFK
ncbi:MAG: hypothetical protein L7F78_08670, partial [Syntrophales bacterium LBB04]|nr:hypothetical protein [Syntrophales bacterium LBB04]